MENYIFGLRPVYEAIKAGKEIDKVMLKNNLMGEFSGELITELRKKAIQMQYVPQEKLDKICDKNHQGVIAIISPVSYHDLEEVVTNIFEENKIPLIVILDSITDVRNFGAIARTCECAGAHAIVIPSSNSVRITEDAIKTSAGALYNIPVCKVANLVDCILLLNQMGVEVTAITEKAERSLFELDMTEPMAIVLGAEDTGISVSVLKRCGKKAKIPMVGKTESLNVSVSAALAVYEALRQRGI